MPCRSRAVLTIIVTTSFVLATVPSARQSAPPRADASDSTVTQLATALLRDWIIQSRDDALDDGVRAIPGHIRSRITGYVPQDVLNRVRWRVGGGEQLSLQSASFYFAETPAITLDHVIVFRDEDGAEDVELWVHELRHVIQFKDWGVEGFAARYLLDRDAVESEASRYRWGWVFGRDTPQ